MLDKTVTQSYLQRFQVDKHSIINGELSNNCCSLAQLSHNPVSWAMESLNHVSVLKALACTFTAISVCSWEFRLSSVSHSVFPAQNSSSSSASFSLISSCSSRSGTSSSCLKGTAFLLNWSVVGYSLVLEQEVPPMNCWTETRPQGSLVYLCTNTGLESREAAPEDHIIAKTFILIWLQKKQNEGSAMWSEFKASGSWGKLSWCHYLSEKVLLDKTEALF